MIRQEGRFFILETKNTQYILEIDAENKLVRNHYGRKVDDCIPTRAEPRSFCCTDKEKSDETKALEFPTFGHTDFRIPMFSATLADGSCVMEFVYDSAKISDEKPQLCVMPSARGKVPCLIVTLRCINAPVRAELNYSVYEGCDVIVKNCRIFADGCPIEIDAAYSQSLTVEGFDRVCYLAGGWARERHIETQKLSHGVFELGETRGSSGHNINPFFALFTDKTTEDYGETIGVNLIYSGNHSAKFVTDRYGMLRVNTGIQPFGFYEKLNAGESFETPESILTYSAEGFGKMSRNFHDFLNKYVIDENWANRTRPVLVNNWEATYFDFDEEKLLKIAKRAKELGIELFVLDDGWFGRRDLDNLSLGDWEPYFEKLPDGISGLVDKIAALGMKFGLWFEPEMISENSELYRKHPGWAIRTQTLAPALGRSQLVLNLALAEVRSFILGVFDRYLRDGKISYIKWDFNRYIADVPYRGFQHRYILGLYEVLNTLKKRYPNVLFEGCSGGGGRFDCGMLPYFPQIWTSDDTDAAERLAIQNGTSMAYPLSCMSAHVTACPNHQTGRSSDMFTRFAVACFGVFGYELDITREPEAEQIAGQIETYRSVCETVLHGDFYRLGDGNIFSWQAVNKEKSESVALFVKQREIPNMPVPRVRLKGLKERSFYLVGGERLSGAYLMYKGFLPTFEKGDYKAQLVKIKEIEEKERV